MEQEKKKSGPRWDEAGVEAGQFEAFREIVAALRGEGGCPWDREQTFESLKPCMINEMTEAIGAIDIYKENGETYNLCEELGDVLLQVVLQAQIAQEAGLFTIEDVIRGISRKMIRRHPHVFGTGMPGSGSTDGLPGRLELSEMSEKEETDRAKTDAAVPAVQSQMAAKEIPGLWEAVKRAEKKDRTPEQKQREREAFRTAALEVIVHLAGSEKMNEK